jgi:hypothetical protein
MIKQRVTEPVATETRPIEPKYLTTEDLADLLRTSPETIRYWRHIGHGPISFKVGRRVLYAQSDVDDFVTAAKSGC